MSMARTLHTIGLAALAIGFFATAPAHAQSGDPRLPSFKDERRFAPRPSPAAPTVLAPKQNAEPAKAPSPSKSQATTPATPAPSVETPPAQKAAAAAPGLPAPKTLAANACGVPEIKTEPLDAGRMQLAIASACRAGQDIVWTYGGAEQQARLDTAGRLEVIIDAFAGTNSTVELRFADETLFSLPLIARDLDRVTKIALIWKAAADLDLHAFEHAAERGKAGHVWSGAPLALDAVRQQVQKGLRGAGFVSSAAKGSEARDKVEVYTFLHRDGQAPGIVTFAVDHATRGDKPAAETCGTGALAEIAFRVVSTSRGGRPVETRGLIARAACDELLAAVARFGDAQLPLVRIRP